MTMAQKLLYDNTISLVLLLMHNKVRHVINYKIVVPVWWSDSLKALRRASVTANTKCSASNLSEKQETKTVCSERGMGNFVIATGCICRSQSEGKFSIHLKPKWFHEALLKTPYVYGLITIGDHKLFIYSSKLIYVRSNLFRYFVTV